MTIKRFTGIVPPVCTPLTPDGGVDKASLERLFNFQIDAGVDALFVLGSSSEGALLNTQQRRDVLDAAFATVAGRVPVLVGAIAPSTGMAIELALDAKRRGADAVVCTVPFYGRPNRDEILAHFRAIHAEVQLPLFAYDVTVAVHSKIPRDCVVQLAQEGVLTGIKDSSGDDTGLRFLIAAAKELPEFCVFTGQELLVDTALAMGVDGAVPGLANVDPHAYVRLYRAFKDGDLVQARAEQERLLRLAALIDCGAQEGTGPFASGWGGFKTALVLRGIISGNTMVRPLAALNGKASARIRELLEQAGLTDA